MLSILLSLGVAGATLWMAYMGVVVTLYPPDVEGAKKIKRRFIAVGAFAIACTLAQGIYAEIDSSALHKQIAALTQTISDMRTKPFQMQIPGSMQWDELVSYNEPVLQIGQPLRFNVAFHNVGGTIVNGAHAHDAVLLVKANTRSDRDIQNNFIVNYRSPSDKYVGETVSARNGIWHTAQTDHPLTRQEIRDIVHGQLIVYVLTRVWGSNSNPVNGCERMQKPVTAHIDRKHVVWEGCRIT